MDREGIGRFWLEQVPGGGRLGGPSIFPYLRLWKDLDHSGVSNSSELFTLSSQGVTAIGLTYVETDVVDTHGNWFRYLGAVTLNGVNRKAYDVYLLAP